jgi:hypothetical protein
MWKCSLAAAAALLLTAAHAAGQAGQGSLPLPQRGQQHGAQDRRAEDNGAVQKKPDTPNDPDTQQKNPDASKEKPETPNPNPKNPNPNPNSSDGQPTVTVFDRLEVQGILGKEVRGPANDNMGRIVDVIVDRSSGQVRAAIIDFGGFLGVGNRRVAVAWNALRFPPDAKDPKKLDRIGLDLTREQVQAAPEYKEDKPVVVLGASGGLESLPF